MVGRSLLRSPAAVEPVSPMLVGSLPVRPSWPMIAWLRMRRRPGNTLAAGAEPSRPGIGLASRHRPEPRRHRLVSLRRSVGRGHRRQSGRAAAPSPLVVRAGQDFLPILPWYRRPAPGEKSSRRARIPATPSVLRADRPAFWTIARREGDGRTQAELRPLARPLAAGPAVRAPLPATDLPVLGAVPLPPGVRPDSSSAVRTTLPVAAPRNQAGPLLRSVAPSHQAGALARWVAPSHRAGPLLRAAAPRSELAAAPVAVRSVLGATPRQRWEAAVAARPLETPRPLPAPFHAMARAITGQPHPPRYTTGTATRHALAATGALGATTGSVVHLPAAPSGTPRSASVLAHELTHARRPVRRPRFLLAGAAGLLDDDERSAVTAGRGLLQNGLPAAAGSALGTARGAATSALGGARTGALDAAGSALDTARAGALDAATSAVGTARGGATSALGTLRTGALDAATTAASTAADAVTAGTVGAGIVDRLPVGGGMGAVGDLATRAARAAVIEATAAMPGIPPGLGGGAGSVLADALAPLAGSAAPAEDRSPPAASSGSAAITGAGPAGASQEAPARQAPGVPLDADRVVELVEERLLREIERRGGRWAGVF
jgi:hypothetical protein